MSIDQQDPAVEQPTNPSVNESEATLEQGNPQQSEEKVENNDLPQQLSTLEIKLEKAEAVITEQKDSVLRAKADVENMRRRAAQDVEKAHKFALERFASELLPIVDNLERAMTFADRDNDVVQPILEGIDLTYQSFISTLEKFELKVVNPEGELFNPELHQAMSIQESKDVPTNTVLAVMQKGYTLNGRLIRPTMVMVSKGGESPKSESSIDTTA